ncbi:MAG TPA: hypothetical protein VMD02_03400 [Candidatus Omnitrophota bacterium]|nr:hypothetical protein [Candidatus Omnitrophota bacterium]
MRLSISLGLAYIIWLFAQKEAAPQKTIGQVIAIAIIVFAVLAAVMPGFRSEHNFKMRERMAPPPPQTQQVPENFSRSGEKQNPLQEQSPQQAPQEAPSSK